MMRRLLIAAVLLLAAASGGFVAFTAEQAPVRAPEPRCSAHANPEVCLEGITTAALDVSATYALDLLRVEVETGSDALRASCHPVAHRLGAHAGRGTGDLLGSVRDAGAGAVICDFGFVHGMLEGYAERNGARSMLDQGPAACRIAGGNDDAISLCLHGLGHSVLIGFDGILGDAVDGCTALAGNDRFACVSGSVMQWAIGVPGSQERSFSPEGAPMYWPSVCESLIGDAQLGCLSQVWHSLRLYEAGDQRRSSVYALGYCKDRYTGASRDACVDGVGQQLWADGRPVPEVAERVCAQSGDDALYLVCMVGYANSRGVEAFDTSKFGEVCSVMPQRLQVACAEATNRDARRRVMIDDPAWRS